MTVNEPEDKWIWMMLGDTLFYAVPDDVDFKIGLQLWRIVHSYFAVLCAAGGFGRAFMLYSEWRHNLEIINIVDWLMTTTIRNCSLNDENFKKFILKSNISWMFIYPLFVIGAVLVGMCNFIALSVKALMDDDTGYYQIYCSALHGITPDIIPHIVTQYYPLLIHISITLMKIIMPLVWTFGIWIGSSAIGDFIAFYYLIVTYLRYRFDQINQRLNYWNDLNTNQLMDILKEHLILSDVTNDVNKTFQFICGMYYYFGIFEFDLSLYFLIHVIELKGVYFIELYKLFGTLYVILLIYLFFLITFPSAQMTKSAHKPYPQLFEILIHNELSLMENLKVYGLIERLSARKIAIYCFNLFPLTYYELYLFIANLFSTFTLIDSLATVK